MGRITRRSRSAETSGRQECAAAGSAEMLLELLHEHIESEGLRNASHLEVLSAIRAWAAEREAAIQSTSSAIRPNEAVALWPQPDTGGSMLSGVCGLCGGTGALTVDQQVVDARDAAQMCIRTVSLKPPASPFAITASPLVFMTLTHDAIRSGMEKALELLSSPDGMTEGCKLLEQTSRLIDLHTRHEDEVFFPFLKRRVPHLIAVHDQHDEASVKRRNLVAKVARQTQGIDRNVLAQVRRLVEDYENHMKGEEQELMPLITNVLQSDSSLLQEAAEELIKHDLPELAAHAVPFTTFQLCRSAPYESIATYASALRAHLTSEAYYGISKVMLMSAFEAKPKYAAKLVDDNILAGDQAHTLSACPSILLSTGGVVPRTRNDVARWLEREQDVSWDWKDVNIDRDVSEVDALMRAERLHQKLAERFTEPLQLRHVMIERCEKTDEQTIYFFIDNTWEMARRALFAKMYTRLHKERGKKLHVVIVDAKERRSLVKREQDGDTKLPNSVRKGFKGIIKKGSDDDSE